MSGRAVGNWLAGGLGIFLAIAGVVGLGCQAAPVAGDPADVPGTFTLARCAADGEWGAPSHGKLDVATTWRLSPSRDVAAKLTATAVSDADLRAVVDAVLTGDVEFEIELRRMAISSDLIDWLAGLGALRRIDFRDCEWTSGTRAALLSVFPPRGLTLASIDGQSLSPAPNTAPVADDVWLAGTDRPWGEGAFASAPVNQTQPAAGGHESADGTDSATDAGTDMGTELAERLPSLPGDAPFRPVFPSGLRGPVAGAPERARVLPPDVPVERAGPVAVDNPPPAIDPNAPPKPLFVGSEGAAGAGSHQTPPSPIISDSESLESDPYSAVPGELGVVRWRVRSVEMIEAQRHLRGDLTANESRPGIVLDEIRPESAGSRAGLLPGDLVVAIHGLKFSRVLRSVADGWRFGHALARGVEAVRGGEISYVSVRVIRDDAVLNLDLVP